MKLPVRMMASAIERVHAGDELKYSLDRPRRYSVIDGPALIAGWAWPVSDAATVVLRRGDRILGTVPVSLPRPDVVRRFGLPADATPGFRIPFPALAPGRQRLTLELRDGGSALMLVHLTAEPVELTLPRRTFYMHVAKTAGSSVNDFFGDRLGAAACAFHIESDQRWRSERGIAELAKLPFVSGHIRLAEFCRRLPHSEYLLVATVREPVSQLISHLAWIRALAEPGSEWRLAAHSPHVQRLASLLWSLPIETPDGIRALIERMKPHDRVLLDNCQTRYFMAGSGGDGVVQADLESAIEGSAEFALIGNSDDLGGFLAGCCRRLALAPPSGDLAPRSNVARSRYGMSAESVDWVEAVDPLIRFDRALFEHVHKAR